MALRHRHRTHLASGLVAAALWGLACTGNPPPPAATEACSPPEASVLPGDFDAALLAGPYVVRAFSDEGPETGRSAEGRLVLRAYPAEEQPLIGGVPATLFGPTNLDLATLGAADTGPTTSEAPEAPGALLLQWQADGTARPDVLIRLGARSNRSDLVVFDGAYTVLRIHDAADARFSGLWESGAPGRPAAGGRFCAVRAVDEGGESDGGDQGAESAESDGSAEGAGGGEGAAD